MIPLDMHGMVRSCRPITPYVGLCRQSRDPDRTRMYYQEARKQRDLVCFHSMLKEATRRCMGYRAIRRLWIQTLEKILVLRCYKYFILKTILDFIPMENTMRIPPFYTRHYWRLDYDALNPLIRMKQFAGKLESMGYPPMVIVEPDYELENYKILSKHPYFEDEDKDTLIPFLYHELQRKNIVDKWPILSSQIRYRNHSLSMSKEEWLRGCIENKLTLYLNACIQVNRWSPAVIRLLEGWIHFMKYPNR